MIAANPIPTDEPETPRLDLDRRVNISIAFGCYVNAERHYNSAARRFNVACKELRELLPPDSRFVIRYESGYYLVQTDSAGEFDMEEIETL